MDKPQTLRLQAIPPQSFQHIRKPFRTVAQGKASAVFHRPACGGAHIVQTARLLHAGAAAEGQQDDFCDGYMKQPCGDDVGAFMEKQRQH